MNSDTGQSGGSLTVIGTGMKFKAHLTLEALDAIQQAEKVFHNVADLMTRKWLEELNPTAEPLPGYFPDRSRQETYEKWVELILGSVRQGLKTCAATYGHPGILSYFSRTSIRLARREGYPALMLPGISTEASLLCDLSLDPAEGGWQSYGATYFLKRKPRFDSRSQLVLWQIRVVDWPGLPTEIHREGLQRLTDYLIEHYGSEHEIFVYEAARNPALDPVILSIPLRRLPKARFRHAATLYVPPLKS